MCVSRTINLTVPYNIKNTVPGTRYLLCDRAGQQYFYKKLYQVQGLGTVNPETPVGREGAVERVCTSTVRVLSTLPGIGSKTGERRAGSFGN